MTNTIWVREYNGYETIMDFDEDWLDAMEEITPNGEFLGTIRITMEYIPSEEDEE